MRHYTDIRRFLKKIITHDKSKEDDISPLSGFMGGYIPDELLTDEMKNSGLISLYLYGEEYYDFNRILEELRRDKSTEYLTDKELKDKLWHILCDIYINRDFYRNNTNLKNRIHQFLSEICQPLQEYEVIFKVLNFDIKNTSFDFWDFKITRLSQEDLINYGSKPQPPLPLKLLSAFFGQTAMIVSEEGNNSKLVVERARQKAQFNLKLLQTYFSDSRVLRDENLLFEISEEAIIRNKQDPNKIQGSIKFKRTPFGLNFSEMLNNHILEGNLHFDLVKNLNPKLRSTIERTIHWMGKSIQEEELDQKIIALCSGMESLLTTQSDKKKGEAIAYRMVLVNLLLEQAFVDPSRVLWIYGLRSKVIHGSSLSEATLSDYTTMLYVVRETLFNFIKILDKFKIRNLSQLIQKLETSSKVTSLLQWLETSKQKHATKIKTALEESIQQYHN